MASQIIRADFLRSMAYSSITDSYTAFSTPFTHAMRMIRIINNTDADMLFSFDPTNASPDNFIVPSNSFVLYDGTANKETNAPYFVFVVGSQLYIKYETSAPTIKKVYLESLYGQGE